jgi:hypothetical protein
MKTETVREPSTRSRNEECEEINPIEDLMAYCREYAREKPEVVALWCLGIGFMLGWKLKPW